MLQALSIDLMRLAGIAAESTRLEHLQARNCQSFTSAVCPSILFALVGPCGSGARVQQDRDEEQVEEPAAALRGVNRTGPRGEQITDAIAAADVEMLPAAVGRDTCIIGSKVALCDTHVKTHAIESHTAINWA